MKQVTDQAVSSPFLIAREATCYFELKLTDFRFWLTSTKSVSVLRRTNCTCAEPGSPRFGVSAGFRLPPVFGAPGWRFSGGVAQGGDAATEPLISDIGGVLPIALCGRISLWSPHRSASFEPARSRLRVQALGAELAPRLSSGQAVGAFREGVNGMMPTVHGFPFRRGRQVPDDRTGHSNPARSPITHTSRQRAREAGPARARHRWSVWASL